MTPYQESLYEEYGRERRIFAIVSWGAAATLWLAETLNRCPGLFCVHAQNFYWRTFAGAEVDGVKYLQILSMQSQTADAVGDVHGISRLDIPPIREFFGDRFRAAVVIRDPLPRLQSQLALFDRWADHRVYDTGYLDELYPDAIRLLPTGDHKERLFVHGANMLNTIIDEITVGPVFRMESLTGDPMALLELIKHVSADAVVPARAWANDQIATTALNRHNKRKPTAFASWQQSILRIVIKSEAIRFYRDFGYDTSWLDS